MEKETWIVAVSGGPDSMALLDKLHKKGYQCIVAHVNYHMRQESENEAKMLSRFCYANGIPFFLRDYHDTPGGNFQDKARNFRYQFFKDLASEYEAKGVAIGHHEDDDLETYLIQKERHMKSDVVGLQSQSSIKGIRVWRPLLNETKEALISYCSVNQIPYAIDQSNFETQYTRNRIRHSISDKALLLEELRLAKQVREKEITLIDQQIDYRVKVMRLTEYRSITDKLRPLVLRQWIRKQGGVVHHYANKFFLELDRQILKGNSYHDFESLALYCDHDLVALSDAQSFRYELLSLPEKIKGVCEFASEGDRIQGLSLTEGDFPLVVRSYQKGDEIEMPYGTKLVSRYFIDTKIPRYQRKNWLVIENAVNRVIFVVGMGCDRHHYSNNPQTFVIE